jgi:pterin-4a-carbinolamine dehydratase
VTSFFQKRASVEERLMKVLFKVFKFKKFKMGIELLTEISVCNHYTFCIPVVPEVYINVAVSSSSFGQNSKVEG